MAVLTLGAINATNYTGSSFISGTASSGILPIGVAADRINSILSDGSDTTYFDLFGASVDRSLGVQFAAVDGRVPANCTTAAVNLALRARNNPLECAALPIMEIWTVWLGADPGRQVGTLTLTSDFTNYTINAPVNPFNGGPWSVLSPVLLNGALFGWRGRTDCDLGGGNINSQWSEARLLVTFTLPEPTVTTLTPGYLGMGAVELRGSFNPNQDINGSTDAANFAPARWFFEFGDTAENMLVVSPPQGDFSGIDAFNVSFYKGQLTPATRYFYRLGVIVDGESFYGDTLDFTTPTVDPSFGAF